MSIFLSGFCNSSRFLIVRSERGAFPHVLYASRASSKHQFGDLHVVGMGDLENLAVAEDVAAAGGGRAFVCGGGAREDAAVGEHGERGGCSAAQRCCRRAAKRTGGINCCSCTQHYGKRCSFSTRGIFDYGQPYIKVRAGGAHGGNADRLGDGDPSRCLPVPTIHP